MKKPFVAALGLAVVVVALSPELAPARDNQNVQAPRENQ